MSDTKIPTAEELFSKYSNLLQFEEGDPEYLVDKEDFKNALVEFAQKHVQAALKAASKTDYVLDSSTAQQKILECYPLDNIK